MVNSVPSKIILIILAFITAILVGWIIVVDEQVIIFILLLITIGVIFWRPFWGLLLFVMLIPLESAFLSLGGGAASVTRLLGFFVFGVWLSGVFINQRKIMLPYELRLAVVFAVYGSVSFIWAFNKGATTSRILTAVQLVMLVLLIVNMVKDHKKLKGLLIALFLGCLIATLLGVLGIGVEQEGYLLTLQNQGAKEFGGYVGIVFLIGSILFILGMKGYRWLGLAALAFATVPLLQVNQRGILLAIGVSWIVIAVLVRQKVKSLFFIALMLLAIGLLPPVLVQQGLISSYNAERLTIQNIVDTGGTGRSEIWGAGFRMFASNPIIGTGWGNFSKAFNQYASPEEIYYSNLSTSGKDAHSDLFGVAGELGIIGVTLFLTLLGTVFVRDVSTFRSLPPASKIYLLIVIALLVYIFSAGLTSTFLWRKVYWVILGMGMIAPGSLVSLKKQIKL
jgi:O-antigen ligase